MSKFLTKQLLLSSNYWVLNKSLVQALGLETAFLLSNFAEAEKMMADADGWFYQTADTVEDMTTLSRHKQDQCIKQLEDLKVLEKDVRGMPPKRYFRINYECLTNQIVNSQQINMRNSDKSICKKSATNKEHTYKESKYKESMKDIVDTDVPTVPIKKEKPIISKNKKTPYNDIVNLYNSICGEQLPNVQAVSDKRKRAMKTIWNFAKKDMEVLRTIFTKAIESDFTSGRNGKWTSCNFDWLVNQNNAIKVLEGNYDNKGGPGGGPGGGQTIEQQLQSQGAQDFLNS